MKEIRKKHKKLFYWMVALFVVALGFLIYGLVNLSPSSAVVKTGYSDIGSYENSSFDTVKTAGGYRDGSWMFDCSEIVQAARGGNGEGICSD